MITISLCMIVKDEETIIRRCLKSVNDVVDEIIIVDTGSTDKTKEVVQTYTEKIYDFEWVDDFSKARDFSFSKATKDYILWLDADEVLNNINKNKLISLKNTINNDTDIISMETHMCMDENNNPKIISRRNRIIKREKNFKWTGFIHEYINVDNESNIFDSDISIIHDKVKYADDRNLKIYRKNIELGNEFTNRDLYYYGKELYCNSIFDEAIIILEEFILKSNCNEEKVDALCKIGESYLFKNEISKGREYLYKTFEYSQPKGDIIYNIANSFEKEKKYEQAITWYEIILNLPLPKDCRQCVNLGCWRFKPHLNLCSCYFEINDIYKSYYHHKKCQEINPLNTCVMANEDYFKKIIREK